MNTGNSIGENRRLLSAAYVAAVLAVLVLVNVIINAFATRFGWYLYTEEKYEHTIGPASETVFADVAEDAEVRVLFCMSEDAMEADTVYALVLNTFRQLAERHDFIKIEFKNIYLHPGDVAPYRVRTLANGEKVEYAINERSVIFVAGDGEDDFRVESLESFFILDSESLITGYNGEEIAISCLSWVLKDEHPVAGFTEAHGENYGDLLAFYTTLVAAGYDMTLLDLNEDIPTGVGLVVIANPRWDFDRGAAGSGIESELDRLAAFLDAGGSLFVSLDPYAKGSLSGLRGFLKERGLTATQDVIRDLDASITYDGYTLATYPAASTFGEAVRGRISPFTTASTIVREASVIFCDTVGEWTAEPILLTSETAETYRNGVLTDEAGSYPVFAVSRATAANGKTSNIFLSSGVYLLANDILNSGTYSNRAVMLASLEAALNVPTPVGCEILAIGNDRLEDLTMGTARLYAGLLSIALPLAIAAVGAIVIIRRKIR